MSYIWINPVVNQMYDQATLEEFLIKYGYRRVECQTDWGAKVKRQYENLLLSVNQSVADVRCPVVKSLLHEQGRKNIEIPDIEPILLHCAREISSNKKLEGEEKLIITPCRSLADAGNELGLLQTRFISWKQFLQEIGDAPEGKKLEKSPIPPGFFDELAASVISITGEEGIQDFLDNDDTKDIQLIELLFCKEGCHRGDGVIGLG